METKIVLVQLNLKCLLEFFRPTKKMKIKEGKVTYKHPKAKKSTEYVNLGKKNSHVKFDSDGNILQAKSSKVLGKVKRFVDSALADTELSDQHDPQCVLQFPNDFKKMNNLDDSDSNELSVSDDEVSKTNNITELPINEKGDNSETSGKNCIESQFTTLENKPVLDNVLKTEELTSFDKNKISSYDMYNTDELNEELNMYGFLDDNIEDVVSDTLEESLDVNSSMSQHKKGKKKKKRRRKQTPMPEEIENDVELRKYWAQRYRLFSKFDEGIRMDRGKNKCLCSMIKQWLKVYNQSKFLKGIVWKQA